MKKLQYSLTVLALLCILFCSIKGAMSYFTTYAEARGGIPVHLQEQTRIREDVSDWTKNLVIHNEDPDVRVYVRAKAFISSDYTGTLEIQGENWTKGETDETGSFYDYGKILEPDNGIKWEEDPNHPYDDTTTLSIHFEHPEDPEVNSSFNVVVVYESVPVEYDDQGNELPPDWSKNVKTTYTEGGN